LEKTIRSSNTAISFSRKRDTSPAGIMFLYAQNFVAGIAGGANRFLAASPTAGGVGGRMAYGGAHGGDRLSEAHFVGGRYGAARRHPQCPGRLPQPHIR